MKLVFAIALNVLVAVNSYESTWKSLKTRVTPEWYDNAKIGIMIHFGIYSATISSEWFWKNMKVEGSEFEDYVKLHRRPDFTYQDYANEFKADLFDAVEWSEILEESGAKYVLITAKHHDGFTLYPSSYSFSWNSVDIGPHVDILKELSETVRNKSMKFGVYYSLMEWFNPLYLKDKKESTDNFVNHKILPELREVIDLYKPEIVWSDGDWEMTDEYWKSTEFLAWLFTNSSVKETVVVNDRWGKGTLCRQGSFVTCKDRFNPGILQEKKFENVLSLDKESWGFDPLATLDRILTLKEILKELIMTISCNGNIMINVGPNGEGRIESIYVERLRDLGKWLKINGEGIYSTKPWKRQNQGENIWFTMNLREIFVFVLDSFETEELILMDFAEFIDNSTEISLLGYSGRIHFSLSTSDLIIELPEKRFIDKADLNNAWTLKIKT